MMMNALLDQKTFRKTLSDLKKWFFRGAFAGARYACFRVCWLLRVCHGPPFFLLDDYSGDIQANEEEVKGQVHRPGHPAQDPAAGAGHVLPEMQQRQGNIPGEQYQQGQRKLQPGCHCPGEQQEQGDDQLCRRQNINQHAGIGGGKYLAVQLPAEIAEVQQLAGGGVYEQQDQQGDG
nr:hypothetical protein [Mucilaginibacter phenanthrenivorans]